MFKFLKSIIFPSKKPKYVVSEETEKDFISVIKGDMHSYDDLIDMYMTSERVTKPVAEEAILFLALKVIDIHIADGKMVNAIKLHRRITNMGLRESKDHCDNRREELGYSPSVLNRP